MKTQGAFVIVINEKNKVLLTKRKDFPIWDLPGGRLEDNESLELCAVREAREETGYIVKINRKIGEYQRPMCNDIQHIYLAEVIGGKAIRESDETSKIKFFSMHMLPMLMVPHRKGQIKDYRFGRPNVTRVLKDSSTFLRILKKLR